MLKISSFYNNTTAEDWFTRGNAKAQSVHDYLLEHEYSLIDRDDLESNYQGMQVPVATVDLSYAKCIPTPIPSMKTVFISGHIYEYKNIKLKDNGLVDVINRWIESTLDEDKFVMSLNPKNYLLATAKKVTYEDIFYIFRNWGVDSFIGLFDRNCKTMFMFSQELRMSHISFDNNNLPPEFDEISSMFQAVIEKGVVNEMKARGGDRSRIEEYCERVIEPNL